ncbi:polysaccharide biosynthesis/export family protein [Asticcacaulis sp.]|uniref:polysaccharide biosynthesis/export family protein n=1 Tax=Asticcacaulis sp. TaxID=1872648 RepID=UPI002BB19E19|nr:polysaccharide biosynthesis/export family protein [Asticcacaulis sp.]HTM82610.1 polysaccharide biosynthesis/export family protein [Asticcacaulis sp.]
MNRLQVFSIRLRLALMGLALTAMTLFGTGGAVHAQVADAPVAVPVTATASAGYEYRLGSGDKIRLIIFGEPDLSGEFMISGDGVVSLPLIREVHAAGLTATQLQMKIESAFKEGYLKDPRVSIEVLSFRPFYILGEVNKPGEYPYSNGITVVNAVALASGFSYRANQKKVFIRHAGATAEEDVPLTSMTLVAPGDTIRIAERYF